ncbi:hypothetical protein M0D69_29745 [Caballeronia sp. SEWSISQ10-4 2]|uniref:hypothetical protein n=1 Tax=Caballeronia sp. SEWSISQ10-4 2 TaxID=2937438 RepID=UPI00265142FF|nr:hypothetical protein [Caballeronia sp. SEWSISQ10-4 2]MDN7182123.1 hypothetical protein [Caballeronia sp. SEWSISQ10-4 2]
MKAAIKQPGINVTREGEIEGTFDVSNMASGFASYVDALLSLARWEFDNAGTDFAVREPSLIGDTQIDVISCHRNASSSELYKLVDLRGNALTANTPIIVVVDDRLLQEQADHEVAVIGQYAEAWPMRKLIEAVAGGGLTRH